MFNRRKYVQLGAQPGPPQNGFKAYTAGKNDDNSASMLLTVLPQPTEKLVCVLPALGSYGVPVLPEQPIHQDRQLVDGE